MVKKKQNGLALLVLVIVIALTLTAYYFSTLSLVENKVESEQKTRIALKQAKQALLDYARAEAYIDADQIGEFGFLPCPDHNNISSLQEGVQESNCAATNVSQIGLLPYITLDLPYKKDSAGACLLYAVSGAYKQTPITGMLNEDTNGQFQVVDAAANPVIGVLPEDRIVAIVFSPGDVLAGQARTFLADSDCGQDYLNVSGYVEGNALTDNATLDAAADSIDQFIYATATSSTETTPYNDTFITITREELWSSISSSDGFLDKMRNLTEALASCLLNYATINGSYRLPFPAPMNLTDYRDDARYDDYADDSTGYAGRLPFVVTDSNTTINLGGTNNLFTQGACNTVNGVTQDLSIAGSEYRTLWENWKDHFFYVVSQDYAPVPSVPIPAPASCGGNCITVNGTARAAMVFFAGSRLGTQLRRGPPDANTKDLIANYLENGNDALFPDNAGNAAYQKVNPVNSNDIMFCLTDAPPRIVVDCTL